MHGMPVISVYWVLSLFTNCLHFTFDPFLMFVTQQLGMDDDTSMRKKPSLNKSFDGQNVARIASGGLHNAAILTNGAVWTWGCNDEKGMYFII